MHRVVTKHGHEVMAQSIIVPIEVGIVPKQSRTVFHVQGANADRSDVDRSERAQFQTRV